MAHVVDFPFKQNTLIILAGHFIDFPAEKQALFKVTKAVSGVSRAPV